MFGLKVASTHEIIEKLEEYEKENGVGAIVSLSTMCRGDRTVQYVFEIANDSDGNRVLAPDKDRYKRTKIEISAVLDDSLFPDRYEIPDK